jgi:hypothetical protein
VTIHDPQGAAGPDKMPRTAKRIGTFEWASSAASSREDTLFISGNRDRSLWILWISMPDLWSFQPSYSWVQFARATCARRGMTAEAAARTLLTAVYRAEIEKDGLGEPLVVRGGTIFKERAMRDLVEAIWDAADPE